MAIKDKVEYVYKHDVTQSYIYSAGVKYVFEELIKAFDEGRLVEVEPKTEKDLSLADLMAKMDTLVENLDWMNKTLEQSISAPKTADFKEVEIR